MERGGRVPLSLPPQAAGPHRTGVLAPPREREGFDLDDTHAIREVAAAIVRLPHARDLQLPAYLTPGAAGCDLSAAVDEPVCLPPLGRALIPTGMAIALPAGCEAQVRPRSGLALRYGVTCLNSPGTIDADYRGEVKVLLVNLGAEAFDVRRGERIAQLVVQPVTRVCWREVDALPPTERGPGGWGSTG